MTFEGPFNEAKEKVTKKIGLHEDRKDFEKEYTKLLDNFDAYSNKTKDYITKLNYPDKEKDSDIYMSIIDAEMKTMVLDKRITKEEFEKFRKLSGAQSENLYKEIHEGQGEHEKEEYEKISMESMQDVKSANFDEAILKWEKYIEGLSGVDKMRGIKAKEEKIQVMQMKDFYHNYFIENTVLKGYEGRNHVIKNVGANGEISLATYKLVPLTKEESAKEKNPDKKYKVVYSENVKNNWWDIFTKAQSEKSEFRAFDESKLVKGEADMIGEEVVAPESEEVQEEGLNLMIEQKLMSAKEQFSYKWLKEIPEEEHGAIKEAMEESFNSLKLYFNKNEQGELTTTAYFDKSPKQVQMQLLNQITSDFLNIKNRMEMEKRKEKPENETMKLFYTAEVKLANNNYLNAYSCYREFLKQAKERGGAPVEYYVSEEAVARAKENIKTASFGMLLYAKNVLDAQPMDPKEREKHPGYKIIDDLSKVIKEGKAADLHEAFKVSEKTLALTSYASFLNFLVQTSEIPDEKEREKAVLKEAKYTLKNGVRTAFKTVGEEPEGCPTAAQEMVKGIFEEKKVISTRKAQKDGTYWREVEKEESRFEPQVRDKAINAIRQELKLTTSQIEKLPDEEKAALIEKYEHLVRISHLAEFRGRMELGKTLEDNKDNYVNKEWEAVLKYPVKKIPFTETLKSAVIDATLVVMSGGAAAVARHGAARLTGMAIAKWLGEKAAVSAAANKLVFMTGTIVEALAFESSNRLLMTAMGAENPWSNFKEGFKHSYQLMGVMAMSGRVLAPLLQKITPYTKAAQEELSTFQLMAKQGIPAGAQMACEAGIMTLMNPSTSYFDTLSTLPLIRFGGAAFNKMTGLHTISQKWNARNKVDQLSMRGEKEKAVELTELLNQGKLPPEMVVALADQNLKAGTYQKVSAYLNDTTNLVYLLALKHPAAAAAGAAFDYLQAKVVSKLATMGIQPSLAPTIIRNVSLPYLLGRTRPSDLYRTFREQKSPEYERVRMVGEDAQRQNVKSAEETLGALKIEQGSRAAVREAFVDRNTGLLNRNGLSEMNRMINEGKKISVVSYDADHFKAYNEVLGREGGDQFIRLIGKNINNSVKELRAAGYETYGVRMGGEEIVIYSTAPKDLVQKSMQNMAAKLKEEVLKTLPPETVEKMAVEIARQKYNDDPNGISKARREIGGSSAGVVEIDSAGIKDKKSGGDKLLKMADEILEARKNKEGRGVVAVEEGTPMQAAEKLNNFKPKNTLNDAQNNNLKQEGERLYMASARQVRERMSALKGAKLSDVQWERIESLLRSPSSKVEEISAQLTAFGYKGNAMETAKQLKNEYFTVLRDHGNYTGASKIEYFQRNLGKMQTGENAHYEYKNVRNIEIGEFKSINETLGHAGGDIYLTFVYQNVILSTARTLKIPPDQIMIAQKGAGFKFCISSEFIAKNPGIMEKFSNYMQSLYKIRLNNFLRRVNQNSGSDWQKSREEWIKQNKQATLERALSDQYKIFINP